MPTRTRCLPALCLLVAATLPARAADFSFTDAGHTYVVSETNRTWQAAATYPVVKSRNEDGCGCFISFDCYILVRVSPTGESWAQEIRGLLS